MASSLAPPLPPAPSPRLGLHLAAGWLWLLSLLQAVLFLPQAGTGQALLAFALAAGSTAAVLAPQRPRLRLGVIVLLALAAAANLGLLMHSGTVAALQPALLRATTYGYAISLACGLAALLWRQALPGLIVAAVVLTLGVVLLDAAVGQLNPSVARAPVVRWVGGTAKHPVLQEYYPPHSAATTLYTSNPRGYFEPVDGRAQRWRLSVSGPSQARLVLPATPSQPPGAAGLPADRVRVEIDNAAGVPWQVQLAYQGVAVQAGEPLMLALRLRADRPRAVSLGLTQAHAPWGSLGLYRQVDAGPDWQDVVLQFTATQTDRLARLVFDLGDSDAAVEIDSVVLRQRDTSRSMVLPQPAEFAVRYRFNDRGCRGDSLAQPAPAGTRRVLLLGDSFTLGVGVHEADTLGPQLQALLQAQARASGSATRWEVVNCGVSGYATRQERQMYERQAPHYQPDIVVLSMVDNDDASWVDDVARGHFFVPGELDRSLPLLGEAHRRLRLKDKPKPDFLANVQELQQLQALCQRDGARLVVAAFRNLPLTHGEWGTLVANVGQGLKGSGAAWIDLGEQMLQRHPHTALQVYPERDLHPNELAHRDAARQLAQLVQQRGWLEARP